MALIAVAADKGAPGVTTAAVALAAVWPRPVLLAECDPAGGDLVYRLPSADGARLDPRRGLLSLAVTARRGLEPWQVWEHAQKLRGGLDVLVGLASAEQGSGLELMWGQLGAALAALPQADVIADCGRIGAEGRHYDLLARADAIVLVTRASLGDMVRLRDRAAVVESAVRRRGGSAGRLGVVVVADHRHFTAALGEVQQVLSGSACPARVVGGLAYEPRSAQMLSGAWGGKLDRSLLMRTARVIAADLAGQLPATEPASARPAGSQPTGAQLSGGQLSGGQLSSAQPSSAQPLAAQPLAALPPAGRPPQITEYQAAGAVTAASPEPAPAPLMPPAMPGPAAPAVAESWPARQPPPERAPVPGLAAPRPAPGLPDEYLTRPDPERWDPLPRDLEYAPGTLPGAARPAGREQGGRGRHAGPPGAAADPGGR